MASSGSFNTGGYGSGDWYRYLNFSWSIQSQSIANNTTTISWTLKGAGGATNNWYVSGPFRVVIDGVERYYSDTRINLQNGTVVASGTVTMSHNSVGEKSFSASVEGAIYTYAMNVSGSGSWSLTTIPRQANITSAPNFNDDQNPTIGYSNPAGANVTSLQACIANLTGSTIYAAYRDISKTGSSYTFQLTEQERQNLRYASRNSKTLSVKFYVTTVIGGNTFYSTLNRTMTIVDGNPTFYMNYKDTNATVVAITNNDQLIVRNQSTLQVNITDAVAVKSASLVAASCVLNGTTYSGTFSGDSCTFNIGTVNISSNTNASLTVRDSRGFTTTKDLAITVLDWVLPSAIITMQRHDNFYSNTDIKVDGSISSVNNLNTMTIKMRYKKVTDNTWSSYVTMQDNVAQTFNLDNNYEWDVQVVITDLFGSTTYNLMLSRGMPIIYFDRNSSSVGVNCFPKDVQSLEVDGVPVNRNIMTYGLTSNITSPTANAYTKIPLDNEIITGARLTANSNGVKIGTGVSKVMVSAQMMVVSNSKAGICYLRIVKNNNTNQTLAWAIATVPAGSESIISITPALVEVSENDVINLMYYVPDNDDYIYGQNISTTTTGSLTWMTVDVVG